MGAFMKTIAIIVFSTIFLSFIINQSFILKHINSNNLKRASKSSWIGFVVIFMGTYAVLVFPTFYLDQDTFSSNLNDTQDLIFMIYLVGLLFLQILETSRIRKIEEKLGIVSFVPFVSRAISIAFMLGYLAIYTLP
jgi:hypothetical protein